MSTCVITVSPLPTLMTFGNGAARQVFDEGAGGDIDYVIHRLSGI
jgi:hypothetical protein